MKISDPIMKTFTHNQLKNIAQRSLTRIINNSSSKQELLFKLAGFYGDVVADIKNQSV
jgi:hypothetical protein